MDYETDKAQFKKAYIGIEAEDFVSSSLGQDVQRRANEQVEHALAQLADADPEDPKAIRRLQQDVKIAQTAMQWLIDIIHEGRQAQSIIEGDQE